MRVSPDMVGEVESLRGRARLQRGAARSRLAHGLPRSQSALAVLTVLAAAWSSGPSRAQDYDGRALSAEELHRLANGELVTRPMRTQRGELRLFGGSSWQVIDAPPEVVWAGLHDAPRYPKMLPAVLQASVVATRERERDIYIHQGAWPIFTSYYVTLRDSADGRSFDFKLDDSRPNGLRAGWGFVRLLPYPPHRTLLAFGVLADVGHGILVWFARSLLQRWMLEIPSTVKHFLDRGGRHLYVARHGPVVGER
ncbi:MAG TPA: SRPBCC family protein [Polyangiales bacterium]